jgi:hypothetical protein
MLLLLNVLVGEDGVTNKVTWAIFNLVVFFYLKDIFPIFHIINSNSLIFYFFLSTLKTNMKMRKIIMTNGFKTIGMNNTFWNYG